MKTIPLTKGMVTIVDDDTYEWASLMSWYAGHSAGNMYYARCGGYGNNGNGQKRLHLNLHRMVLGLYDNDCCFTDHINHDTLDNRRCNLRVCTPSENSRNKRRFTGSSLYRGVSLRNDCKRWSARIYTSHKECIWLGLFKSEYDAAVAYDKEARALFGEFACLNFPDLKCREKGGE